jgi:thioredoxin-related protein
LLSVAHSAQAGDIAWQAGFDKAMRAAGEKQQPVLVFATMQGCGYCKRMYHETYADKSVASELNRDFIPVWLDADSSEEVLARLGVEIYPTTLIFSAQGKLIGKLEGYEPTPALRSAMKDALSHRVASKKK